MRTALVAIALTATVMAGAGCGGGGGDPAPVLSRTAANLGKIRSGDISFSLHVEPRGGREFGFEARGPFSLASSGGLPVADIDYTQIANGQQATATLITTGSKGFVRVGDTTYALPGPQTEKLKATTRSLKAGGGLGQLRVDDWIRDPKLSDGGDVGGAATDHVSAGLDAPKAIDDLFRLSQGLGGTAALNERTRQQLSRATRSATIDIYAGKEDHLLRRLEIVADFGLDVPKTLAAALGQVVGAKVTLQLEVDHPNRPVHVTAPANALPASQFPGS